MEDDDIRALLAQRQRECDEVRERLTQASRDLTAKREQLADKNADLVAFCEQSAKKRDELIKKTEAAQRATLFWKNKQKEWEEEGANKIRESLAQLKAAKEESDKLEEDWKKRREMMAEEENSLLKENEELERRLADNTVREESKAECERLAKELENRWAMLDCFSPRELGVLHRYVDVPLTEDNVIQCTILVNEGRPIFGIMTIQAVKDKIISLKAEKGKAMENKLSLNVQLVHGSPTIKVTDFSSIVGLFNQISKGFKIQRDDIVFCTINTHKADMSALFTGSLEETDILFVHLRGQPVEVEMMKNDAALGVTIADNGLCRSFIKRIREQSVADAARPALGVGQLIENIDGKSVLGLRHYEVAKLLRSIPVGKKFTMRLVNPLTSGFSFLQPRGAGVKKAVTAGTGMGTIRFKADGGIVVQAEAPDKRVIDKLNELFDSYLGVQDDELAQTVWDAANKCNTLQEMEDTVRNSELNSFDFPEELVFDMWGIVGDLKKQKEEPIKISSDRAFSIPN